MNNLRSNVRYAIERAQMNFSNDTRLCIIKKPMPELTVAGKIVGPFSPATEVFLPNWAIETLLKHGLVEIEQKEDYASVQYIQDIYRNEEESTHMGLHSIHPLLYAAISKKLIKLQSEKASLDPKQYDEREKLQRLLGIISQKRLSKILRVAVSGAYQDKRNDMTLEERWLCEEISKIISDWKKHLII